MQIVTSKFMRGITRKSCAMAAALGLMVQPVLAGDVLIVNGIDEVQHGSTVAENTTHLTLRHEEVGNRVTVLNDIPDDLTPFDQVWDIRVGPVDGSNPDNIHVLTAAQQQQYLAFLQSGGGMFLMGENSFFTKRNNSVLSLIALAGGGNITLNGDVTFDLQRVHDRFNQPNPITDQDFFYGAADVATTPGTGFFMTELIDREGGSAIAWDPGTLANALMGTLTVIFDINFLERHENQEANDPDSDLFVANLIQFIVEQVAASRGGLGPNILSSQFDIAAIMVRQQIGLIAGAMGLITLPMGSMGSNGTLNLSSDNIEMVFEETDLAAALSGDGGFSLGLGKDQPVTLFVNIARNFGEFDNTANQTGFDYAGTGGIVGLAVDLNETTELAAAIGHNQYDGDFNNGVGSHDSKATSGTLFLRKKLENHTSIEGFVGYAGGDFDYIRKTATTTNVGNTDFSSIYAGVAASRLYDVTAEAKLEEGNLMVGPMARLFYTDVDIDGYRETSGGAPVLTVSGQDQQSFTGRIGLEGRYAEENAKGELIILRGHAAFEHEFDDDNRTVAINGGTPSTVALDGADDSRFVVGGAFGTRLGDKAMVDLSYEAVVANSESDEQTILFRYRRQLH